MKQIQNFFIFNISCDLIASLLFKILENNKKTVRILVNNFFHFNKQESNKFRISAVRRNYVRNIFKSL